MSTNFTIPPEYTSKIYVTMCIGQASPYAFGKISFDGYDASSENYILLAEQEVTIPIDTSKDIKAIAIASLQATKDKVQAEAYQKVTKIQAKIDDLLVIEYQPEIEPEIIPEELDSYDENGTEADADDEIPF